MTHIPVGTRPDPGSNPPLGTGPVELPVSLSSRVVADGFDDEGHHARVCMLLRPWVGAGTTKVDISAWPSAALDSTKLATEPLNLRVIPLPNNLPKVPEEAKQKIRELATLEERLAAPEGQSTRFRPKAALAWPADADKDRIDRLWRRTMDPEGSGSSFWKMLASTLACPPAAEKCTAYLPTPHGAASLMFTLQRGRAVLETIASPDSAMAMLGNGASEPSLARPWYQGERLTRFASLGADVTVRVPDKTSPENEEFWLTPYRERTAAVLAGETPNPIWPNARTLARNIFAGDLPAARAMECILAAHHLTTPQGRSEMYCASPDEELATAQRRLGALLSLPTLQRLFGFAFDLLIEKKEMANKLRDLKKTLHGETPGVPAFVALAPPGKDSSWTLARFEPDARSGPVFCPASWDEVLGDTDKAPITMGMRNLARRDAKNNPVYDIITIDPALASESKINNDASIASDAKGSALAPVERSQPVLHNGGLRVIEAKDNDLAKSAPSCPSQDVIEDANDLKVGDRLIVGLEIRDGQVLWRSPDYRVIEFLDPKPESKIEASWIETELSRRHLKANGVRRVQLDGAMAMSASQKIIDEAAPAPRTTPDDPVFTRAIKIIEDSTVALWGSDPAGVAPPEFDQKRRKAITKRTLPVIEELDITRHFSSPSHPANDKSLLSPTLRFGWSYYAALAPVFEGGGSMTPDDVAKISRRRSTVSLPPVATGQSKRLSGRRFLRHERVNAPMVLLLDKDVQKLGDMVPPQRGADMYVRTMKDGQGGLASTRRLIVPPPVPLQFAMLHDVLRDIGQGVTVPKQGLNGLSLLGAQDKPEDRKPNRAQIGDIQSKDRYVYFPDPAASVMVFGLKLPAEAGLENAPFVEAPVAVPVGARTWPDKSVGDKLPRWPNVVPIHLQLKAAQAYPPDAKPEPRIESVGRRWLKAKGELADKSGGGAVEVQLVEVRLAPGETLSLQAWCAPTVAQLADWFDAIESAGLLLIAESKAKGDPHAACIAILKEKLNAADSSNLGHNDKMAAFACLGAGGLTAPPKRTIQTIAGLVYRELLLKPSSVLASPLTMRLTHAVDDSLMTAPEMGPDITITRRKFATVEAAKSADVAQPKQSDGAVSQTPADFLTNTPLSEWGLSSTQEGATDTLIGGEIHFEPASTGGLLIEATSAAPFDELLDDPAIGRTREQRLRGDFVMVDSNDKKKTDREKTKQFGFILNSNGTVDFSRKHVTLLKLDGLPLPKDGRSGLRPYSLQALMAAAWGDAHEFGLALRAALPGAMHCSGARRLSLSMLPINRHSGLLPAKDAPSAPRSQEREVWLPATTRPSPPLIDHVNVALSHKKIKAIENADGSFTVGVEQTCVFTIWHARPFFSSGEGEKIALVLWPPGIFARGTKNDDKGQELFPVSRETDQAPDFYDEDLGPGGPFVTRWAADPLTGDDASQNKFPTGPFIDPSRLSSDGERIPRAFMPVPISNQAMAPSNPSDDRPAGQTGDSRTMMADQKPLTYMAVALHAFEPRFDPIQELWYINVALTTDPLPFPRVRLGLVRYQAHAREDDVPLEGSEPVRLRVSTPVKEWVKPLPGRRATVTCHPIGEERMEVTVVVDGPSSHPEAKKGPRPRMIVEVIRHKTIDGIAQERIVMDSDGTQAICEEWSSEKAAIEGESKLKGIFFPSDAGYHWNAMFTIHGPLEDDGWSHSVVVRETRQFPRARAAEGNPPHADTGPVFLARIPLKKETNKKTNDARVKPHHSTRNKIRRMLDGGR